MMSEASERHRRRTKGVTVMATKKTTTPSKLDVAIEYLKKIANTTYVQNATTQHM